MLSNLLMIKLKRKHTQVNDAPALMWFNKAQVSDLLDVCDFEYASGTTPWSKFSDSDFWVENFDMKQLTEYDYWNIDEINYTDDNKNELSKQYVRVCRFHIMSVDLIEAVISFYNATLTNLKDSQYKYNQDTKRYEDLATKALNAEVASSFMKQAQEFTQKIADLGGQIVAVQNYLNIWNKLYGFLINANAMSGDEFELVYYFD